MLITLITTLATTQNIAAVAQASSSAPTTEVATSTVVIAQTNPTVEGQVKAYFSDIPVLISVARCESDFRQTNKDGSLFRGKINKSDVGVMQINQYYNASSALRLGYNIETLQGNMAFARHLYEVYGTDPWSASQKCWDKDSQIASK